MGKYCPRIGKGRERKKITTWGLEKKKKKTSQSFCGVYISVLIYESYQMVSEDNPCVGQQYGQYLQKLGWQGRRRAEHSTESPTKNRSNRLPTVVKLLSVEYFNVVVVEFGNLPRTGREVGLI